MNNRWRSTEEVEQFARDNRREPTKAEAALWAVLRNFRHQGLIFRRQAPVGKFIPDFYCASARLAVELDGSIHYSEAAQRHDAERQEILEQAYNIRLIRLTNDEVLSHPISAASKILAFLDNT